MHCLFCKADTRNSRSVEHIIPESLGNTEHILPRGLVCDTCNNYFARKVEKPFLDTPFGKSTRAIMGVSNKRGRIPPIKGIDPKSRSIIEMIKSADGWSVGVAPGQDESRWIHKMRNSRHGVFYIPMPPDLPEANRDTARFIGKVAIEVFAAKCQHVEGANAELVNHPDLDKLRTYVRVGTPNTTWPLAIRRIYDREHRFSDHRAHDFEVLHEWMILATDGGEYYCIVAIFGVEFAINLGGPDLDGWNAWLAANGNRSPLLDVSRHDR